jgi:hypothetical protein
VRKVGRWSFYALAGIATAAAGFVAQHLSEAPGDATILSNYAFVAFLTSGFIGGLAYWASSGRFAARGAGPAAPTAATTTAAARPTAAAPAGPTT